MPKTQSFISGDGISATLPTSYEVREVMLTSNSGKEYNITAMVGTIEIKEGLGQETIDVEMGIVDANQFLESAIISGSEKITLKIVHTSNEKNKKEKRKFDLKLRIAEITDLVRLKPGAMTYFFICYSEHMYTNAVKRLVRPFEGSIGSVIDHISRKDLDIEKINTINTKTKGIIKGIFPRLKPIDAINWLNRNAYDDKTPFFWTDTVAVGIIYDSWKNLVKADVHREYVMKTGIESRPGTPEYYTEVQKQVTSLSSSMNMSPLVNLNNGAYASTVHSIDVSDKSFSSHTFNYETAKPVKLNKNPPIDLKSEGGSVKFTEGRDSSHHYISLNSNSWEGYETYSSPTVPTILNAESIKSNITSMGQTIVVAGDYTITPGKKIILTLPKSLGIDATGTKDKFLTGTYIITKIIHMFREEYKMILELKKDSSLLDLSGEGL